MRTYIPCRYELSKERYLELLYFCLQYDKFEDNSENRRIIDDVLDEVAPDESTRICLLKNIRWGLTYEKLGSVPLGRRQFYDLRRKFFFVLSEKRE